MVGNKIYDKECSILSYFIQFGIESRKEIIGKENYMYKTEEEWRKILTKEEFEILRKKGTERAFTGKYDKHFEVGDYNCAGCGSKLFTSNKI